jgi:hypothetical protein
MSFFKVIGFSFSAFLLVSCGINKTKEENNISERVELLDIGVSFTNNSESNSFNLTAAAVSGFDVSFTGCTGPEYNPSNLTASPLSLATGSLNCAITVNTITLSQGSDTIFTGNSSDTAVAVGQFLELTNGTSKIILKLVRYDIQDGVSASDNIAFALHQVEENIEQIHGTAALDVGFSTAGQDAPRLSIVTDGIYLVETGLLTNVAGGDTATLEVALECDFDTSSELDGLCAGFDMHGDGVKAKLFPDTGFSSPPAYSEIETVLEDAAIPSVSIDLNVTLNENEAASESVACGFGTTVTNNGVCIQFINIANFDFNTNYMLCVYDTEFVEGDEYHGVMCTSINFNSIYTNPSWSGGS